MVKKFVEDNLEIEEKALTENYKSWKKSVPFLHDMVTTHTLHWPSFTFEWLRSEVSNKNVIEKSRIMVSATTNEDKSHLLNADVHFPDVSLLEKEENKFGVFNQNGGGRIIIRRRLVVGGNVSMSKTLSCNKSEDNSLQDMVAVKLKGKQGLGIYDMVEGIIGQELEDEEQMVEWHGQDVVEPFVVADNYSGTADIAVGPSGRFVGALKNHQGVGLWCINDDADEQCRLPPRQILGMTKKCDLLSVDFWESRPTVVVAGNSAGDVLLWDTRNKSTNRRPTTVLEKAYSQSLVDANLSRMYVSTCPRSQMIFATCASGSRGPILWDIRNLKYKLHTFGNHYFNKTASGQEVDRIKWSPHFSNLLAGNTISMNNSSSPGNILIWDLDNLHNEELMKKSTRNDPADLVFVHGGHTGRIGDFAWHPDSAGVIGSTADDNIVHIWKANESFVNLKKPNALYKVKNLAGKFLGETKQESIVKSELTELKQELNDTKSETLTQSSVKLEVAAIKSDITDPKSIECGINKSNGNSPSITPCGDENDNKSPNLISGEKHVGEGEDNFHKIPKIKEIPKVSKAQVSNTNEISKSSDESTVLETNDSKDIDIKPMGKLSELTDIDSNKSPDFNNSDFSRDSDQSSISAKNLKYDISSKKSLIYVSQVDLAKMGEIKFTEDTFSKDNNNTSNEIKSHNQDISELNSCQYQDNDRKSEISNIEAIDVRPRQNIVTKEPINEYIVMKEPNNEEIDVEQSQDIVAKKSNIEEINIEQCVDIMMKEPMNEDIDVEQGTDIVMKEPSNEEIDVEHSQDIVTKESTSEDINVERSN